MSVPVASREMPSGADSGARAGMFGQQADEKD